MPAAFRALGRTPRTRLRDRLAHRADQARTALAVGYLLTRRRRYLVALVALSPLARIGHTLPVD